MMKPSHGKISIDRSQAKKPVPAPKYVVLLATDETAAATSATACALCSDTVPPKFWQ